jgi:Tfp pilus assembly protein PilF
VTSSVRQWSFERNQTQIPVVLSDEVTGDFLLAKTGLPPASTASAPPTPTPVHVSPPDSRPSNSQPSSGLAAIEGDVIGADGQPVSGATIAITRGDINANYRSKTDAKGHYLYAGLPVGHYHVSVLVNDKMAASIVDVPAIVGQTQMANFKLLGQGSSPNTGDNAAAQGNQAAQMQRNKELNERFNAGLAAAQAKNYSAAIDSFRRTAELDPNQHVAWAHLGEAYLALNQVSEAIGAYERAVAIKPDDAAYHNNYSIALARAGKVDQAAQELEVAARLDPVNAGKYFYNLGAVFVNTGKSQQAETAFRRATEVDPNYADAYFQLGICLMGRATVNAAGRVVPQPGTVEAFQKYLQLAPSGQNAGTARTMLQSLGVR